MKAKIKIKIIIKGFLSLFSLLKIKKLNNKDIINFDKTKKA